MSPFFTLVIVVLYVMAVFGTGGDPDSVEPPYNGIADLSAVAMTDLHEIQSARILVNPFDFRDFYRWDINQTGWAFKDRVVAGETITSFGEFQIQRSIRRTPGNSRARGRIRAISMA